MFKKSILLSAIAILSACSMQYPKYVVSDEDLKKLAIAEKQGDQCFNADFVKKIRNKKTLSDDDNVEINARKQVLQNNVRYFLLSNIIGKENIEIINNDYLSRQNLFDRYNRYDLASLNVPPLNKIECAVIKKPYMEAVKARKAEIKQQIANQKAQERKVEEERKAREAYYKTPAGQAELARQQQERHHQEMMALQRQQIAQQREAQDFLLLQQQMNQTNQQIQQINQQSMQMLQMMTPQRVIIGSPVMSAPIMGTGPRWNNVY